MTDHLPDLRGAAEDRALGPSDHPPRPGGSSLRNFFSRYLRGAKDELEEWEVRYAAIGAVTCLAAAGIATVLPEPVSIANGSFDVFGFADQEITVAGGLLEALVSVTQVAQWPLAVLGVTGLILDAYLAVRLKQHMAWRLVCDGQMLFGFLAGLTLVAIFFIVLANIAIGLLAAALVVIVGVIVLGMALAILGGLARL